jgi:hypothetical protein
MKSAFVFIVISLLFIRCGKDGTIGPEGEKGLQGDKGAQGEKGINGVNGSTIYSGKTAPTLSIGSYGDFFLDLSQGNLYGPKSKEGWGKPFNMKGEQGNSGVPGSSGAPGTTILSGSTVPPGNSGKIGDFYINLQDMTVYGPKTISGWGGAVSLKTDVENNVSTYLIKPDWNKNLIRPNNSVFTSTSGDYVIPGNVNTTFYVMYVAGSQISEGLYSNVSLNKWEELTGEYTNKYYKFDLIKVGSESLKNVRIERKLISTNVSNSTYKFDVFGEGNSSLNYNSIWLLIKCFQYKELKSKNMEVTDFNRYLRIR